MMPNGHFPEIIHEIHHNQVEQGGIGRHLCRQLSTVFRIFPYKLPIVEIIRSVWDREVNDSWFLDTDSTLLVQHR